MKQGRIRKFKAHCIGRLPKISGAFYSIVLLEIFITRDQVKPLTNIGISGTFYRY